MEILAVGEFVNHSVIDSVTFEITYLYFIAISPPTNNNSISHGDTTQINDANSGTISKNYDTSIFAPNRTRLTTAPNPTSIGFIFNDNHFKKIMQDYF